MAPEIGRPNCLKNVQFLRRLKWSTKGLKILAILKTLFRNFISRQLLRLKHDSKSNYLFFVGLVLSASKNKFRLNQLFRSVSGVCWEVKDEELLSIVLLSKGKFRITYTGSIFYCSKGVFDCLIFLHNFIYKQGLLHRWEKISEIIFGLFHIFRKYWMTLYFFQYTWKQGC